MQDCHADRMPGPVGDEDTHRVPEIEEHRQPANLDGPIGREFMFLPEEFTEQIRQSRDIGAIGEANAGHQIVSIVGASVGARRGPKRACRETATSVT
jgi:hypothetical protein